MGGAWNFCPVTKKRVSIGEEKLVFCVDPQEELRKGSDLAKSQAVTARSTQPDPVFALIIVLRLASHFSTSASYSYKV